MFVATIGYHVGMIAIDIIAILQLRKKKTVQRIILLLIGWGVAALSFAIILGENGFGRARLVSYGLSIHASALLFCWAILLQKTNKKLAFICILIAIILSTTSIYAFILEPHRLDITEYRIQTPKIKRQYKIAVISDFQTDYITNYERAVLMNTLSAKPDLILLTGDYLQPFIKKQAFKLSNEFNECLQSLRFFAPLGVYAVRGDVEGPTWRELFAHTSVRTFEQTDEFEIEGIKITALSRKDSRNVHLYIPQSAPFHIVFGHSPDYSLGNIHADLLIAGHTHGGQIRLPFVGPIYIKSKIPRQWGAGMTSLDDGRKLIVSRGIGMERGYAPRFRFLCRPELVFLDLTPMPEH